MLEAKSPAPRRRAAKGEVLYNLPISACSMSDNTGRLTAPGMRSSAYSAGERTSIISSKPCQVMKSDYKLPCR